MTRRRAHPQNGRSASIKRARLEPSKTTKIEYQSPGKAATLGSNVLDTHDKDGIICSWTGKVIDNGYDSESSLDEGAFYNTLNFTWNFDWTKLKAEGVEKLSGFIIVKAYSQPNSFSPKKIDIDWTEGTEKVFTAVQTDYGLVHALFEYHFTAHYVEIEQVSYEEMFAASDKTDVILVVEGKKLHVNKAFLSIHSDFFSALFSSNFKEGQLTEIPIEDVSYQDFGLLMSIIYPKTVFANDKTAEKLLELADRFLMPFVTVHVEHHLLNNSNISNEKLMFMADAYGMPKLLEKTIIAMNTLEKFKHLEESPEYATLSKDAKSSLFDRIMQII